MTRKVSTTWTASGIDPRTLEGVHTISVTVRDRSRRIVAMNHAVSARQLKVTDGCTTTIYNAAVHVSPGHITTSGS